MQLCATVWGQGSATFPQLNLTLNVPDLGGMGGGARKKVEKRKVGHKVNAFKTNP